jgi:hypothetical protein
MLLLLRINSLNMSMHEITSISLLMQNSNLEGVIIDSEKSGAIEAVKFILNVLKQHNKEFDHLVTQLGDEADKIKKVGESLDKIQAVVDRSLTSVKESPRSDTAFFPSSKRSIIAKCRQWKEFKSLSNMSEMFFFQVDEKVNTVKVYALKGNLVLTCFYDLALGPQKHETGLKIWISRELNVTEDKIIKGFIALE